MEMDEAAAEEKKASAELNKRTLVSLDIENNKFQELEGALFLHLGLNGPIPLRHIKASNN